MPAGVWKGRKAIGNSIAYDSNGKCVAVLPYGVDAETVLVVEVTVRESRHLGTELADAIYETNKKS